MDGLVRCDAEPGDAEIRAWVLGLCRLRAGQRETEAEQDGCRRPEKATQWATLS
ncbi:hypothetical protein GCM10011608_41270 [Micromonospora sonchi]|uniref:Uncharacterized protein n=1 Tax=Micromonospora sonchi TaxID=1763543 RepID=A0A917U240_9ACTN|nr:hypothetical protein GCM10011608_41270 [Micromonospora sonchi]